MISAWILMNVGMTFVKYTLNVSTLMVPILVDALTATSKSDIIVRMSTSVKLTYVQTFQRASIKRGITLVNVWTAGNQSMGTVKTDVKTLMNALINHVNQMKSVMTELVPLYAFARKDLPYRIMSVST